MTKAISLEPRRIRRDQRRRVRVVGGDQLMSHREPEVAFPSSGGTPIIFFSARGAEGGGDAVWRSAIVGLPYR
jgi:hypothetical protein